MQLSAGIPDWGALAGRFVAVVRDIEDIEAEICYVKCLRWFRPKGCIRVPT